MLFGRFYTVVVDRCDMELLRCSRQDCDYRTTSEAKLASRGPTNKMNFEKVMLQ